MSGTSTSVEIPQEKRADIETLAGYGFPLRVIASLTGFSAKTLERKCKTELQSGRHKANAQVAETLFQQAIGGDTACLIFWAKTRMRWRERRPDDASREEKMLIQQCRALGVDPVDLMKFLSREHARLQPKSSLSKALNP